MQYLLSFTHIFFILQERPILVKWTFLHPAHLLGMVSPFGLPAIIALTFRFPINFPFGAIFKQLIQKVFYAG